MPITPKYAKYRVKNEQGQYEVVYLETDVNQVEGLTEVLETKAEANHEQPADSVEFKNDQLTVEALGGIKPGESLAGLSVEQVLSKLLFKHVNHTVSGTSNPNGGTFECGDNKTVTAITANVTKKSNPITKVEILDGSTVIQEKTDGVSNGGSFNFTGLNLPVTANKYFTVRATANGENGQPLSLTANTGSFNFVYPYYQGVCANDAAINESLVKSLTKKVEGKGNKSVTLTTDFQRAVFAFPKSYGAIKQILDPNNFDVTGTFGRQEVTITGLDGKPQVYYVYVNSAYTASGFTFRFNY